MSQLGKLNQPHLIQNVPNPEPAGYGGLRAAMMNRYYQQMLNPYGLSQGSNFRMGGRQPYSPWGADHNGGGGHMGLSNPRATTTPPGGENQFNGAWDLPPYGPRGTGPGPGGMGGQMSRPGGMDGPGSQWGGQQYTGAPQGPQGYSGGSAGSVGAPNGNPGSGGGGGQTGQPGGTDMEAFMQSHPDLQGAMTNMQGSMPGGGPGPAQRGDMPDTNPGMNMRGGGPGPAQRGRSFGRPRPVGGGGGGPVPQYQGPAPATYDGFRPIHRPVTAGASTRPPSGPSGLIATLMRSARTGQSSANRTMGNHPQVYDGVAGNPTPTLPPGWGQGPPGNAGGMGGTGWGDTNAMAQAQASQRARWAQTPNAGMPNSGQPTQPTPMAPPAPPAANAAVPMGANASYGGPGQADGSVKFDGAAGAMATYDGRPHAVEILKHHGQMLGKVLPALLAQAHAAVNGGGQSPMPMQSPGQNPGGPVGGPRPGGLPNMFR